MRTGWEFAGTWETEGNTAENSAKMSTDKRRENPRSFIDRTKVPTPEAACQC